MDAFNAKAQEAKCQHPKPFIPMFTLDTKVLSGHIKDQLATLEADVLIPLHGQELVGKEVIKQQLEALSDEDAKL